MDLAPGDTLGPYEILARIGAGGMGQVYRARDTRLRREVAIKVSAERFSERFEREARAVAALNHPNICTIHDVGPNYIVMELVEGEAPQGPLPLELALNYARQIGSALEAAHEKGITHRDLKPANIKIKPDGVVKVLDFGLAKLDWVASEQAEDSPTLSMAATQAGLILGTAGYMSPEQARGKKVDRRADIWAFGVVLYEMLVGKRLFKGDDVSETLASVIKEEPKWDRAPVQVRRLLQSCLEKDPKNRLRDMADAWRLLDDPAVTNAQSSSRLGKAGWIAAGVFLIAAGVALWAPWRTPPPAPEPMRFQIFAAEKSYLGSGYGNNSVSSYPIMSPDGRRMAFIALSTDLTDITGSRRLWIRALDAVDAKPLPGTEGVLGAFWSPDGRFIAFASNGKLRKIDAFGGPSQPICDLINPTAVTGTWNAEGVIVFSVGNGVLQRVSSAGGVPIDITSLDPKRAETFHARPTFLPDGQHFIYFRNAGPENSGVYVGALDAKPAEQSSQRLLAGVTGADFVLSPGTRLGHLLFLRDSTLMAQPFDIRTFQLSGDVVPVAEMVGSASSNGYFSSSANGILAFRGGTGDLHHLTWYNREGKAIQTAGQPGEYNSLAISPDGTRVAAQRTESQGNNLWLIEFARSAAKRFTIDPGVDSGPVWSPDGSRIAFASNREGALNLYMRPAGGIGGDETLVKNNNPKYVDDWSRDGKFLIYADQDPKTKRDLWVLPMEGDRKPAVFLQTDFNESEAKFSPDGHWVVYESDASGHLEIYVRPYPATGSGSESLVSTGGGSQPRWRHDGKELFFFSGGGKLMAVDVTTGATFKAGVPHLLFQAPIFGSGISSEILRWDVTSDGQSFLINTVPEENVSAPITIVLNWQSALKK
jgi:serine/threonine protein kinase/Tol biopolymer transport system component